MYAGIATGTLAAAKVQLPAWLSGVSSTRQAPEESTSCTYTRLRLQIVAAEIKDEESSTRYVSGVRYVTSLCEAGLRDAKVQHTPRRHSPSSVFAR